MQFENVSVRFGEAVVLHDISLELRERRIGLIGNNGSGKSTLARLINGLILPTAGRVSVDDLDTQTHAQEIRRRVGFVFQNADAQIVMPTVAEDVAFGPKAHGLPPDVATARGAAALQRFGLDTFRERACFTLSGGEKQALALAGVMALDPAWIVFDEPTTMLDRKRAKQAMAAINGLSQNVIVVTHHVELLGNFERVIVLDGGKVVCDDTPAKAITYYVENFT
ncbi:MAG: ABC transporter ATP-binding protein [Rhodospirillaceae bacterium]|nr:ABC transporter ATP-binding protein [Rhodospirillaceae bacterium]